MWLKSPRWRGRTALWTWCRTRRRARTVPRPSPGWPRPTGWRPAARRPAWSSWPWASAPPPWSGASSAATCTRPTPVDHQIQCLEDAEAHLQLLEALLDLLDGRGVGRHVVVGQRGGEGERAEVSDDRNARVWAARTPPLLLYAARTACTRHIHSHSAPPAASSSAGALFSISEILWPFWPPSVFYYRMIF